MSARIAVSNSDKPPYQIPSMREITRIKPNGLKLVSTFSGCGGSCLGFRMEGFATVWASEFVAAAREAYRANHPGVLVDDRDIRDRRVEDILEATGAKRGEIDVVEGSPPCSSYSVAGSRSDGWGKSSKYSETEQRTDDLFSEFLRVVEGLAPRVFVAENVPGLVRGPSKGHFRTILAKMKSIGYRVESRLVDAQWLGVPQARVRLIFIGVREDLGRDPAFPKPLKYRYSIEEAFEGLPSHDVPEEASIEGYAVGRDWERVEAGDWGLRFFNLARPFLDQPCPTVTQKGADASAASVAHPTEPRKFTIPELRRICGFPDDFILPGTYAQQWERLGRAVPPPMMRAIARVIRNEILEVPSR